MQRLVCSDRCCCHIGHHAVRAARSEMPISAEAVEAFARGAGG
jgi:hypothetical protein